MKKLLVLLMFSFIFCTDYPLSSQFNAGQKPAASVWQTWLSHGAGDFIPVSENNRNYSNGIESLGSAVYNWKNLYVKSVIANGNEYGMLPIFGSAVSGSYITTGNITLDGIKQFSDFTLSSGNTLTIKSIAAGGLGFLKILVTGTMTIAGNINGVGSGGVGGALGVAGSNGLQFGGTGGSGGGNGGTAGGSGGAVINQFGTYAGGVGDVNVGKTGVSSSQYAPYLDPFYIFGYGAGGGGGLINVGNIGGSGGGGFIAIAKNIVISGNPTITCAGENGATGGGASTTAGGSGGGGVIGLFYKNLTGTIPILNVAGGAVMDGFANDGGAGGSGCTLNKQIY